MFGTLASIEVGTHTARLLVVRRTQPPEGFRPLIRDRQYVHLGSGLDPEAELRVVTVLNGFRDAIESCGAQRYRAVGTGIIRASRSRDRFLSQIENSSGVTLEPISGQEEARLTGLGALHALGEPGPTLTFDLGGGSTELFLQNRSGVRTASVEIGAVVLAASHLSSDPPPAAEMTELSRSVSRSLEACREIFSMGPPAIRLVGTGGTVTTISAMIHGIPRLEITPERINGLKVNRSQLDRLIGQLGSLSGKERTRLWSLDAEKAEVIVAGALAVEQIMEHARADQLTVSSGGLLEGIIIDELKESEDGRRH